MALLISDDCINCDMCEPECPNQAISLGKLQYQIDPDCCTECVGHYKTPSCVQVCPIGCISIDLEHQEGREQLLEKFTRLQRRF